MTVLVDRKTVVFPPRKLVEQFLKEAQKKTGPNQRLSIDLETTGLDPHSCQITIIGMSHNGHEVILTRPEDLPVELFNEVMADEQVVKVFHNAKFDMKFLMRHFGTDFKTADCTYIMRKLVTCGLEVPADLESCAGFYLGVLMDKSVRQQFIGATVMTEEMLDYAAHDVQVTWHLWEKLKAKVYENELDLCYNLIERPLIPIVGDMELRGVNVDLPYLKLMQTKLEEKIVVYQSELDDLVRYFGAMPGKTRKLKVAEKREYQNRRETPPDEIFVEEESLNINSSKQVTSVLNLIGFEMKSSKKEALEAPYYTAASVKAARLRLKTYGADKHLKQDVERVVDLSPALGGGQSAKERELAMIKAMIAAKQAGVPYVPPKAPEPVQQITVRTATLEPIWKEGMTDEDVLKIGLDICQRILDLRAARKAVDGFCIPLQTEHVHALTGKIHTEFGQIDTSTGRFANRKPNFQQMPSSRKDSVFDGMTFRRAFVAGPGRKIFVLDYETCENRILAQLSRDPNSIAAMSAADPHTANAAIMFEMTMDEVLADKKRCDELGILSKRQMAKTAIFTLVYGGGPKRIAAVLKCSIAQAKHIIDTYYKKFPGVKRWMEAKKAAALRDGYVLSLSGRRRFFNRPVKPETIGGMNYQQELDNYRGAVASIERQAQNAPVQGTNADITKYAMVLAAPRLKPFNAYLLLSIHDELVGEAPEEHAERCLEITREAMLEAERTFLTHVECKADGKVSSYWEK